MALAGLSRAKPQASTRSPERERLVELNEQLRAAIARRAQLESALSRATTAVLDGGGRVTEATEALAAAQKAVTDHWIDGATDTPSPSVRDARARLADAEAATEAARGTRDEVRRRLAESTNADLHQMQLRASAEAVMRAELQGLGDAMVEAITSTLDAMVERAELVRRLAEHAGLFAAARNSLGQFVGPVGAISRLALADFMPGSARARARGGARYQEMVDALIANPDAVLDL